MNQDKQPEALRLADLSDLHGNYRSAWDMDASAELRRQHARIAELEAELVKESARTADYKLRAEQFEQRLDMANKLGNEARAELAALKASIIGLKKRSDEWKWRALNAEEATAPQAQDVQDAGQKGQP